MNREQKKLFERLKDKKMLPVLESVCTELRREMDKLDQHQKIKFEKGHNMKNSLQGISGTVGIIKRLYDNNITFNVFYEQEMKWTTYLIQSLYNIEEKYNVRAPDITP